MIVASRPWAAIGAIASAGQVISSRSSADPAASSIAAYRKLRFAATAQVQGVVLPPCADTSAVSWIGSPTANTSVEPTGCVSAEMTRYVRI